MSISISNYSQSSLTYLDATDTAQAQELMDRFTGHHPDAGTTSAKSPVRDHAGLEHISPKQPRVESTEDTAADKAAQSAAAQWAAQQAAQAGIRG
jgi:hypothetical protein